MTTPFAATNRLLREDIAPRYPWSDEHGDRYPQDNVQGAINAIARICQQFIGTGRAIHSVHVDDKGTLTLGVAKMGPGNKKVRDDSGEVVTEIYTLKAK